MTSKTSRTLHLLAAAALLTGLSATAQAQAVINHSKALAGNVTPGDAPGYPITISRPGHYRLGGNLTVPAGSAGIEITADHVTLDLNGFTVGGPGQCTFQHATQTVSCSSAVFSYGVYVAAASHTVLRNGTVRGFGRGIQGGGAMRLADLVVTENSENGAMLSTNADGVPVVERSAFVVNGANGLMFDIGGLARAVNASNNGGAGIRGDNANRARVVDSIAVENGAKGVQSATVQGTHLSDNKDSSRSGLRSAGGNADDAGVF